MYKNKLKKLTISSITILTIIYLINIIFTNLEINFYSTNFVLAIISIPCCLIYYKINTNPNLYMYILVYISVFIENAGFWLINSKPILPYYIYIDYFLLFRLFLHLLMLFPKNKISFFIKNNKENSIILTILINLIFLILNIFTNNKLHLYNPITLAIFRAITFLTAIITILILMKRAIKTENFIETTYTLSLIILYLRLTNIFNEPFKNKLTFNMSNSHFFAAFFIILIGLYIEINYILLENTKLNEDVENISNHIKEIKEVENLRSQFFANLSHELKTPINIIYSTVQLLNLKKGQSIPDFLDSYEKYDKTIKQNCFRMIRLINNLVDLTKIDSGFISTNFHNYNIVNLVENICMSIVPYLENKNINLTFDTLIEDVHIKCDSDYIERIILNVLSNSIKFSNDNGNILIFMDCNDDYVTIKVTDDGIGLDTDKINSIFEPFIQGDKSLTRKKEGSGIGLSLVKSLVELHDGLVFFNPDIRVGSELVIKLPNVILPDEDIDITNFNAEENNTLSKINIEFSDIYE